MKILEIASADEQIGLWRLITNSVWSSLDQQAREQAEQKALQKKRNSQNKPAKRGSTGGRPKPPPPLPTPTPSMDKNPQSNQPADAKSVNSKQMPNQQTQPVQQRPQDMQGVQSVPIAAKQPLEPIKPVSAMSAVKPPIAPVNKQQPLPVTGQIPKPQWAGVKQR